MIVITCEISKDKISICIDAADNGSSMSVIQDHADIIGDTRKSIVLMMKARCLINKTS